MKIVQNRIVVIHRGFLDEKIKILTRRGFRKYETADRCEIRTFVSVSSAKTYLENSTYGELEGLEFVKVKIEIEEVKENE